MRLSGWLLVGLVAISVGGASLAYACGGDGECGRCCSEYCCCECSCGDQEQGCCNSSLDKAGQQGPSRSEERLADMNKFDAALKLLVRQVESGQNQQIKSDSPMRLSVLVADNTTELESFLNDCGGRITSKHGKIVSCIVNYECMFDLAKLASVKRVEGKMVLLPDKR